MPDVAQPAAAEQKPKKRRLWLAIGIGVIILIVVIIILALTLTSGAAKVSDQFLTAIQQNKPTEAYALFTQEAVDATNADEFATAVNQAGPILNGVTTTTSRQSGTTAGGEAAAQITYEVRGTDGITYIVTVNLEKENGDWKVLNFDSSKKE